MIAVGLPDWGAPLGGAEGAAWLVHEEPARALALPTGLVLERDDGRPGYVLEAFRISSGLDEDMFGVLTLRFIGDYDLTSRQAALSAQGQGVRLQPLPMVEGFIRFVGAEVLAVPDLGIAQPLLSAGAGVKLALRLSGRGLQAFQQVVHSGVSPVVAQLVLAAPGMAARAPASATIDGSRLLSQLEAAPNGLWSRRQLLEALDGGAFGPAVELQHLGDPVASLQATEALADRLTVLALAPAAADEPQTEPLWRPRADALAGRRLTLRCDDETIAPRQFLLNSPGLVAPEVAMHELAGDGSSTRIDLGFHLVTVDANLPARRVGAALMGLEISVPAAAPSRPQTINRTLKFEPSADLAAVPLRLAPDEPLHFTYQTFVIAMLGGSAERVLGPELRNEDAHLTLQPDAFAVEFVRAEATQTLLEQGNVAIDWSARRGASEWLAHADLTLGAASVAVARPRGCEQLGVEVALIARDGAARLEIPAAPEGNLWLDLSNVAEAAPQVATLRAHFRLGDPEVAIECAPDTGSPQPAVAAALLRLTPDAPAAEFRWLPDSPFRAGYRCRWAPGDGQAHPWSPPMPGGGELVIEAADRHVAPWPGASATGDPAPEPPERPAVDSSGLELLATGAGAYAYRALAPALQMGPHGRPAIQLISAGSTSFLQLTAEWSVRPARLEALSAELSARDGAPPRLSPAPDSVRDTALLLADADGAFTPIATGSALGAPPQTSLLSASLDESRSGLVRRAMAGERGVARVRYTIDAVDPAEARTGFDERARTDGVETSRSGQTTRVGLRRHVITAEADLADLIPH